MKRVFLWRQSTDISLKLKFIYLIDIFIALTATFLEIRDLLINKILSDGSLLNQENDALAF